MKIKSKHFQIKRRRRYTKGREIGKTKVDRDKGLVLHLGLSVIHRKESIGAKLILKGNHWLTS